MKHIFLLLLMLLTGCSSFIPSPPPQIVEKTVTIEKRVYPEMPPAHYPDPISLIPFKWDFPRTKDTSIDTDSNLYIGLTEENYRIFLGNWDRIMAREKLWRAIIDNENSLRRQMKLQNTPP